MTIYGRIRATAALSVLLLTATACASQSDNAAGPDPGLAPLDADVAVIRVEYTGGFTTPAMLAARLPLVAVYGDGRVITEGPTTMIYPGPALPNLQMTRIQASDIDALVERALAAGVGGTADLGQPPVADAPSTRITVVTGEGEKVLEVYALGEAADQASGLSAEQVSARTKISEFLAALTNLSGTLGAGAVSTAEPYVPTAVAALTTPWVTGDPNMPKPVEVAWPGPELPGTPVAEGLDVGCVLAYGEVAAKVLAAAGTASSATPWTSAGKDWSVILRPMLPDEAGCADLKG